MTETIETQEIKAAHTQFGVAPFITKRFSPRAFSEESISPEVINALFEAASWAPSANNEQPWMYYFAHKNTEGFEKLAECLMPGNHIWAQHAAALVVTVARKTFEGNGNSNGAAEHDLGMANATLLLQAAALEVFGHPMGGFFKDKAADVLGLEGNSAPICMLALGYLGSPEQLDEPFKARELSGRNRKPLEAFVKEV